MAPTFPVIVVRHEDYHSAGESLTAVRDNAVDVHGGLVTTLANYGGMAGTDKTGTDWAKSYDEAAGIALEASAKLVSAFGRTANLLAAGAYNHAAGEAASNPQTTAPPSPPNLSTEPSLALFHPSASGDSGPEPFGWGLIKTVSDLAWPDGHQDQLRAAKSVWHSAATALVDATGPIPTAVGLLENQQSPEIASAIRTCNEMAVNADQLAGAYRAIGDACEQYAQHLDDAHSEILSELRKMLIETAAMEGVIQIGAFFTGGLSEAGNAGVLARIGIYAARIGRIITELGTKVLAIARRVGSLASTTLKVMTSKLGRWLEQAVAKIWRGGETGLQLYSRSAVRTNVDVLTNGGHIPMTQEIILALAQKAGVDLSGVELHIVKDMEEARYLDFQDACGVTPAELGGRQIRFGPAAFTDEETLVATLAHEAKHVQQLRDQVRLGTDTIRGLEDEAYAAEVPALARFRGEQP
ncbi:hypothetical protein [Nocardia arthritidis]|uniref:Outer membrane channel protein CpnT-like N-terminal domain-containing protein n=1 Tax=Nocardia arthritidis TaxID=228602 RepID=A0A6G9Y408_9NOCA|nr:hypothetical protein [Nocardia arthritidis]QIS07948.1 hypothetical protein F5544_00060 [Nocardia arthritidis]